MNAKDCENIGYYIAMLKGGEYDIELFIADIESLDSRITVERDGFQTVIADDDAVVDIYNKLMVDSCGIYWSIIKRTSEFRETSRSNMEKAKSMVLNDEVMI